jgi:hypothetical protein
MTILMTNLTYLNSAIAEFNLGTFALKSANPNRMLNINPYSVGNDSKTMAQIPSVSQLRDVQTTDWAFQTLQSLAKNYSCTIGNPYRTDQDNRVLTRYEFVYLLKDCFKHVNQLIAEEKADSVSREDLVKIKRLQKDFAGELATLEKKVENLEGRTTQLEEDLFSTTTKLSGNISFSGLNYFSGEGNNQLVWQQTTSLRLSSSFTGRDMLSLGLTASNADTPKLESTNNNREVGNTSEGLTTWAYGGSTNNNVVLRSLEYIFPVIDNENEKWFFTIAAINGFNTSRFLLPMDSLTWEGYELGSGPVSAFAQRSPLYRLGGGTGVLTNYDKGPWRLTLAYLASQAANSNEGAGLFNGDSLSLVQLNFTPNERLALAFTYFHNYFSPGRFAYNNQAKVDANSPGYVGTALANRFDNQGVFFDEDIAVASNTYGFQGFYQIDSKLVIGGFAAKTDARLIDRGDADIWSYAISLAFPDLGKEGNLGGLIVGVEPTLTSLDAVGVSSKNFKRDTSLHIEAFYRHQVTENISITPGLMWITAPNQDADNKDIVLGLIRTSFSF